MFILNSPYEKKGKKWKVYSLIPDRDVIWFPFVAQLKIVALGYMVIE